MDAQPLSSGGAVRAGVQTVEPEEARMTFGCGTSGVVPLADRL